MIFVLFGFFLGKIIPIRKNAWKKWYYNRFGIPYFVCHMLQGGHIIGTTIAPQNEAGYEFNSKQYIYDVKTTDGVTYTPYIDYYGEYLIFHNSDNLNPLEFKSDVVTPASNDPQRFASMIANKDIRDATHPRDEEFANLKKFILLMSLIGSLLTVGIMWFIIMGLPSG